MKVCMVLRLPGMHKRIQSLMPIDDLIKMVCRDWLYSSTQNKLGWLCCNSLHVAVSHLRGNGLKRSFQARPKRRWKKGSS